MRIRHMIWLAAILLMSLAAVRIGGAENGGPLADTNLPPAWGLDYIGSPEQEGESWYDYQHNSSITRMIAYGTDGSVHCAWMKGMTTGVATDRHIYYNKKLATGTWVYGNTGTQIDTALGSGYCTLDLDAAGNAYVAFHGPAPNRVYVWSSSTGIHILPISPVVSPLVWAHIAVDNLGYIHIIAQTNPVGAIYRTRSMDGGVNWDAWTLITTPAALASVSQTACAGPPGKVAMAWTQPNPTVEVFYIESTDNGASWGAPVNLTNFTGGTHPDAANSRAYYNVNLLYDASGNLHAVYTTVLYPTATIGGKIWHWSQATGHRYITGTYVANAWTTLNPPGAWTTAIDKSALALDAAGVLYVQWGQCTTPGDVGAGTGNYGNWDVYATYSTDGGMNWKAPVNVTDTATPGAPAGQCLSEAWASVAKVATTKLHVQYIKDLDAGGIPQTQGTWTLNPVIYQGVPVDSIQTIMNVDLTATLPIVIPPGGGSFNFTVTIANTGYRLLHLDAWLDVALPSGTLYPILNRLALTLPPGGSIVRPMTQNIPASAPAGAYTYWAHAGTYPWSGIVGKNIWAEDSFPFSKSGVDNTGWGEWTCSGWEDEEASTAPINSVPETHLVANSYPNPFNPTTTIRFSLPETSLTVVSIYNVAGREVAKLVNGWREAGSHQVTFDASGLASGMYLYRIQAGDLSASGKLMLLK